jgi:hypothetical protein
MPVCREKLGIACASKLLNIMAVNADSDAKNIPSLLFCLKVCMISPVINFVSKHKQK